MNNPIKFVDQFENNSHVDPERDLPNIRLMHFNNGQTIKLERKDPFGFIHVVWNKGAVPDELSGTWTTFDYARRAVEVYINNQTNKSIVESKVEKAPPYKYKQGYQGPPPASPTVIA